MKNADQKSWWSTGSWFPSLYSSFSTKIVENLQLEISNVHFRYECKETRQFAFGLKIKNLSAQTANEDWVCLINFLLDQIESIFFLFLQKNITIFKSKFSSCSGQKYLYKANL